MYKFKVKNIWCFKGGGGSAGSIDYPDYMEDAHKDWLDDTGVDNLAYSVVDLINTAFSNNPYQGEIAYNPQAMLTDMNAYLNTFRANVTALAPSTDWTANLNIVRSGIDNILTDTSLDDEITANDAIVDDRLNNEIIPRFQAGMRNINAVNSSIFILGESNLEGLAQRDKNRFASNIRHKTYLQRNEFILRSSGELNKLFDMRLEYLKIVATLTADINKINILAEREEQEIQLEFDTKEALWNLDLLTYGGNMLASISGAVGGMGPQGPTKAQSTLGGALSGASIGASSGGWVGALAGGILGAGAGYASN